jgi:hypothetical protein
VNIKVTLNLLPISISQLPCTIAISIYATRCLRLGRENTIM